MSADATSSPEPIVFDFSGRVGTATTSDATVSNSSSSSSSSSIDEEEQEADAIAKQLISVLVEAFKGKEGRDPTAEEVEDLMSEMTEERIEALMSGKEETTVKEVEAEEDAEEEAEVEAEEEAEEEAEVEDAKGETKDEEAVEEAKDAEDKEAEEMGNAATWHDVQSPRKDLENVNVNLSGNKREAEASLGDVEAPSKAQAVAAVAPNEHISEC